jgi:MFS family permease
LASFSLLAAFAGSFAFLVIARSLQAVCAAALGPGVQSLLRSMAARGEQGRVFGILGSAQGAGAASGPVVGGLLIQIFDWRGIFVINVPIVLLAMVATLAADAERTASLRSTAPSTTGRILNPVFVSGYSSQALTTQAQYAMLLITPIVLDARGWSAGSIGVVLSALTVGMIVSGPIGGRVGDALGRRLPSMVGIGFAAAATIVLLIAGPSVDPVVLTVALAVFGLGLGAATPNLISAALGSVPESRTGAAAGVFTTSRYVGSITTTALIALWVTDDGAGMRSVLTVSVVCMALGLLAAAALEPRSRPNRSEPSALSSGRPAPSA